MCTMKKRGLCQGVLAIMFGILIIGQGLLLAGCPASNNGPTTPPPTDEAKTATLYIEGDLPRADTADTQKAFTNHDLLRTGNTFAEEANTICAYLYEPRARGKSLEKGGGAVAEFCGKIVDGHYVLDSRERNVVIPVGLYELYVSISYNGSPLFSGRPKGGLIQINSGDNQVDVVFDFEDSYWLNVVVSNVPASLGQSGTIKLVSARYPQSMSWYADDSGMINFSIGGPVQFTGGTAVFLDAYGNQIVDASGNPYAFDVPIDMANNYGNPVNIRYEASRNIGNLLINSTFTYNTRILVNGEIVDNSWDLPNALFDAGEVIEMYVPEGDFVLGYVQFPPATVITLHGEGVKSRLHACFTLNHFNYGMGKKDAAKGGGTLLEVYGVTVVNDVPTPSTGYQDATMLVLGVDTFTMTNCAILSSSRVGVELSYVPNGTIENCNFLRYGQSAVSAVEIAYCGPSPVSIKNSIFANFPTAVSYDYAATYAGFYNCLWNCGSYTNQGDLMPTSFVIGDPLWQDDFILGPGSPCIGRGENGQNMGVFPPKG